MYKIVLTKQAVKDAKLIESAGLKPRTVKLLQVIRDDPYRNPPPYEKLQGVKNTYARRINRQHRVIYESLPNVEQHKDERGTNYDGVVKIIRMWTHYE